MFSTIKFIILGFLAMIGIKQFNQELADDIFSNPLQYGVSLFCGMFTYLNIHLTLSDSTGLVVEEFIKMAFSIFTAVIVVIVSFIAKKLIEPLWEQRIKTKIYKFFKIKK